MDLSALPSSMDLTRAFLKPEAFKTPNIGGFSKNSKR